MNPLVIQFKVAKRVAQMVFERIDTLEYAVVKGLFAQIVPEMFNGIELGRVWRKCEQAQVVRQSECSTLMPPASPWPDTTDEPVWGTSNAAYRRCDRSALRPETSAGSALGPATRGRFRGGRREVFFPGLLGGHIGFGVSLVRRQLAPAMTV
jgi:hypothetical protein